MDHRIDQQQELAGRVAHAARPEGSRTPFAMIHNIPGPHELTWGREGVVWGVVSGLCSV